MTKMYSLRGADGNDITIAETIDKEHVVISIQQNDDKARIATVRLTAEDFDELCHLKYAVDHTKRYREGNAVTDAAPVPNSIAADSPF